MTTFNFNNNLLDFTGWFKSKRLYSVSTLADGKKIIRDGEKKALALFRAASQKVPAYRDFLKNQKIKPSLVRTMAVFAKIPVTTKENYIDKYPIKARCWDGSWQGIHMISTSSGTSGEPCLWPRNLRAEIQGAFAHEFIFKNIFNLDKKKTLFINGFAMGNWIAGTFTLACANLVSWKGYPLISMTPGYSSEAIIKLLVKVAPEFEQTIIAGHTPFLKELAEGATRAGVLWAKINARFLGTGQAVTESWRKYIMGLVGGSDYYRTFINLYGSADAGLMGFETPVSIYLRRILEKEQKSQSFFSAERLPSVYNFDPRLTYFEEREKELCLTKDGGCPLIKYNIHDEGGVIPYQKVISGKRLPDFSPEKEVEIPSWQLPFVYLFGREKFMVKIFGANIYTEHVQLAFSHEKLQSLVTGRFVMETGYDQNQDPELICRTELNLRVEKKPELANLIQEIFVEEVRRLNSEYNFVLKGLGNKARPKVILYRHGHSKYFPEGEVKKTA